jgi:predicted molibdopterin-dependent oxidoreductase YjgC
VQLNQPAVEPPGIAFADWAVIAELAVWLGFDWAYDSPEDVFEEMAALTPQYAGISYERLLMTAVCSGPARMKTIREPAISIPVVSGVV